MAMQEKMYARAQSIFERMSPEEQQAEEADMVSQGFTSDEDQTEQFIKKYTNPELFQAAMQEAKPNAFQEIGSALTAGASALGAGLKGQDAGAAGARATKQNREAMDRPGKALEATQGRVFDYLDRQTSIAKAKGAEERAQAGEERKVADFERQQTAQAPLDDPSSDISVMSRGLAGKLGIPVSEEATAAQLNDLIELRAKVKRLEPAEMSAYEKAYFENAELDRKSRQDIAKTNAEAKAAEKKLAKADKDEEKLDRKIAKIPKALSALEQLGVIRGIENALGENGMSFEEYTALEDKPDLPGANIPGLGRVSFYSGDARQLQARTTDLANRILKERSGAAVTTPEFDRFLRGAAQGKFNTEKEMFEGLAMMKTYLLEDARRQESSIAPEALSKYRTQGGLISDDYAYAAPDSGGDTVMMVNDAGEEYPMPADEVDEATAGGWKIL